MAASGGRLFSLCLLLTICYLFIMNCGLTFSVKPKIAIKQSMPLTSDCSDHNGNTVGHQATWPTSSGSCDQNRCWHGTLMKFVISYTCPSFQTGENPDPSNCFEVSDSSKTFPDCCPTLSCNSSIPQTTVAPTACYDLSSNSTCSIWYAMTDGCKNGTDGYNDRIYNFTKVYCRKFCQFC